MKLQSRNEAETRDIGRRIGERLKRGDVVCLYGDLGAGKTTMVKGIASALGISEREITSASFTIIAEHEAEVPLYHIDLYRLTPEQVPDLGLHEYLGADGISVIEWADHAGEELPDDSIIVRLGHKDEDLREVEIRGMDV